MVDIGTSSIRAGYAGEDIPRSVIPTSYGVTPAEDDEDVSMDMGSEGTNGEQGSSQPARKVKMHIGHQGPSVFRHGMEIKNPMQDGLSTC